MKQRVNLYLAIPEEVVVRLAPRQMLEIFSLFLGVLIIWYGMSFWTGFANWRAVRSLRSEQQTVNLQIKDLQMKSQAGQVNLQLQDKIAQLEKEMAYKSRLAVILKQMSQNASVGFSSYLKMISENIVPGVWLEKIDIANQGMTVAMDGKGVNSFVILDFAKKLQADKTVPLSRWHVSDMTNVVMDKNPVIQFHIQNLAYRGANI